MPVQSLVPEALQGVATAEEYMAGEWEGGCGGR